MGNTCTSKEVRPSRPKLQTPCPSPSATTVGSPKAAFIAREKEVVNAVGVPEELRSPSSSHEASILHLNSDNDAESIHFVRSCGSSLGQMHVFVTFEDGIVAAHSPLCIEVAATDCVTDLQQKIEAATGIKAEVQVIYCDGFYGYELVDEPGSPLSETPLTADCDILVGFTQKEKARLRLLRKGINTPVQDISGTLKKYIKQNDIEVVTDMVVFYRPDELVQTVSTELGVTPLVLAAGCGSRANFITLFAETFGMDINQSTRDRQLSPLCYASRIGCYESVKALLGLGASPLLSRNTSPLMYAATYNNAAIVRLLLSAARDGEEKALILNQRNTQGDSALVFAAQHGHLEVARILLANGANVDLRNESGATSLMYAAQAGHVQVVLYLLQCGAEVDAMKDGGWTALMLASRRQQLGVVRALVEHGASPSKANQSGHTATYLAQLFYLTHLQQSTEDSDREESELDVAEQNEVYHFLREVQERQS